MTEKIYFVDEETGTFGLTKEEADMLNEIYAGVKVPSDEEVPELPEHTIQELPLTQTEKILTFILATIFSCTNGWCSSGLYVLLFQH